MAKLEVLGLDPRGRQRRAHEGQKARAVTFAISIRRLRGGQANR